MGNSWKEWLALPIRYCDLPLSSQLTITIWDSAGPRKQVPLGGTTTTIFNPSDKSSLSQMRIDNRTLRTGHQKLKLWSGKEADGLSETSTPGTFSSTSEMDRLEKLVKRHDQGDLPRLDWLDNLAFRKIEQLHTSIKSNGQVSDDIFVYLDFPRFDFPIIFSEIDYTPPSMTLYSSAIPTSLGKGVVEEGNGGYVCVTWDPDAVRDNPMESKHRRLVRSHRNGPLDRDLKPNPKMRDELNVTSIVSNLTLGNPQFLSRTGFDKRREGPVMEI
jgi:phosphatidylinositol 3-kinase